jgi:AcrR family transcriptional regulator
MTQKTFFTKEAILEAAFTLTREEGWGGVTARNIAKKLGSSTMPIYSSMKSMDEIESEVRSRAEALMLDFQKQRYTGEPPLDMAVGYVTFARDEKALFRFLFVDRPSPRGTRHESEAGTVSYEQLVQGTEPVRLADQVPTALQDPRILKSWIFTHGLASLLSGGVIDLPDGKIKTLLLEAGAAFEEKRNG